MTTVDATPGGSASTQETALIGPLAGDPSIFGLASFIAGSVALGLALVGVVPAGVLGAPLAIILAATALGLLMATVWLSYAVLVLGLDHSWFAITVTAVLATVRLFLLTWLIIIVMLTLATLRLPSAFTAVFALVDLALLLLLLGYEQTSAAGVPSSGLIKTGGYVVLVFAALGVYLFFSASQAGTGGKPLPLGRPLMR